MKAQVLGIAVRKAGDREVDPEPGGVGVEGPHRVVDGIAGDRGQGRGGSAALRFLRARILVTMGVLEKAERTYRELITRYPARPEPYNNLARLYSAQGKLDQAASLLRAGLYTDPAYRALFDNLTRIYAEQATRSLSAALDPLDAQLHKALPLGTLSEIPTLSD